MRSLVTILVAAVLLFPLIASATIINIPGDYPTIQEGIAASANGDTVLLARQAFHENIDFLGRAIMVTSNFIFDPDTMIVNETIINGDSVATVVNFHSGEGSSSILAYLTITNGFGTGGYGDGGGVTCRGASPSIIGCNIQYNTVVDGYGGGIHCLDNGSPIVESNNIHHNKAVDVTVGYSSGGGLWSRAGNAELTGNLIHDNFASSRAGGVGGSTLHVSRNTIYRNTCNGNGGGVQTNSSSSLFEYNVIFENHASLGGGICFQDYGPGTFNPVSEHNTIYGNTANSGGGLYCCSHTSGAVSNSIVWNNTGGNIVDAGVLLSVTYSDVQGGWPGTGNIDADPIFVGPEREDFHLRWHSPCIDAGDPDFPLDPDGTRSDIGAFYFNQDVPGIVELYPHNPPIVIPPEGGEIIYDGWLFNFLGHPGRADIWTYAFVPGIGRYGPIDLYANMRIPADSLAAYWITQHVPGAAPEGDYVFAAYVGDYPASIIDSSYFYFSKSGLIAGGVAGWQTLKGWFDGDFLSRQSGLPTQYALGENYPNPFNARTIVDYQLPVTSSVKLEVYNLLGEKVTTLVDEMQEAGYKSVNWGVSSLASGLYFYKLTAGDFTETKRMMLVK